MHKKSRLLALFMTFVLLFSSVSFAVSAEPAPAAAPTRVMEVESLRETNAETYLMSDGSYECVVYAYDKYYKAPDNTLQLTSSKIVPAAAAERSGKLSSGKVQYKNAANAFDVHFSASGTPEISVAYQGASVTFSPVVPLGTSSRQTTGFAVGKVTACKALDTLTYTGDNTVTYSNAFPNTDLVYVLENNTLKEYIILNNANASNSFQFSFVLDGVTLESKGKYAEFTDRNGAVLFSLDALFAVDANGAFTDNLRYTFTSIKDTNTVTVTVTLDEAFLTKAAFPVVIDPSVVISSSETQDACVCSYTPNTNYQSVYQLRTGMDTDFGIRKTYIQFVLPAYIYGSTITAASVELELLSGGTPTVGAYPVPFEWSAATITWDNQPGYMQFESPLSTPGTNGSNWYAIDVKTIVQSWADDRYPNYGMALCDQTVNDPDHWNTWYSSNAPSPHKPELHITYTSATPEPEPEEPEPVPVPFRLIRFYGVSVPDHDDDPPVDHNAVLREAINLFDSKGYTDTALLTGYFDPETFKNQLLSAGIVTTLSHGYAHRINGEVYATGLLLNQLTDNPNNYSVFMNKNYSNSHNRFAFIGDTDDFSNLDLVVFAGCETALEGTDGTSLASRIVDQGAHVAVGFKDALYCNETLEWIKLFYYYLLNKGCTVEIAARNAVIYANNSTTTSSKEVYGTATYTINQYYLNGE